MDADQAQGLVEDHLKPHPDDPLHFVFVATSDEWSETLGEIMTMAVNSEIPYEVITSPEDKSRTAFRDVLSAASKTHSVSDPVDHLKNLLVEASGGRLFMSWDTTREDDMQEYATMFLEAGVPTYDLTDQLTEIGFPEEAEAVAEAEAEGDEEEAAEGEVIYSKSELQKLDRQQLWAIADQIGVKRSRASAVVIEDILAAQGEPGEAPEEPSEPTEPEPVEALPVQPLGVSEEIWERLDKAFDKFTSTLLTGLEDMLSHLTPPTATEPEPEPEPQPTRRRLQRSRS
jgi:hypothetical protein